MGLWGQRLPFQNFSLRDGLPQAFVYCIEQDSFGYLWMGHQLGLSRFDGRTFENLSYSQGLAGNNVQDILIRGNEVWAATSRGISVFDGFAFKNYNLNDGLPSAALTCLAESRDSTIWVGSEGGLAYFRDGQFTIFAREPNLRQAFIVAIVTDDDNAVWVATRRRGLYRLKNRQVLKYDIGGLPAGCEVSALLHDHRGRVWVGTTHGLYYIGGGQVVQSTAKLERRPVRSLYQDSRRRLWIGHDVGLSLHIGDNTQYIAGQQGFVNLAVLNVYEDAEGQIWMGTFGAGLFRLQSNAFSWFQPNGRFAEQTDGIVWAVHQRPGSNDYLVCTNNGLYTINQAGQYTAATSNRQLMQASVRDLVYMPDGSALCATLTQGVWQVRAGAARQLVSPEGIGNRQLRGAMKTRDGTVYFTTNEGLLRYNGQTFAHHGLPPGYIGPCRRAVETEQGELWVSTGNGVAVYREGSFLPRSEVPIKLNELVEDILISSQSGTWLLADRGLYQWQGDSLRLYNQQTGLESDLYWAAVEDSLGGLWFGGSKGINVYDQSRGTFKYLGYNEGFQPIGVNGMALTVDRFGQVWIGTLEGAVRYSPDLDIPSLVPPRLFFNRLHLDERPYAMAVDKGRYRVPMLPYSLAAYLPIASNDGLQVSRRVGRLEIGFIGLHTKQPDKVAYRYRLVGFDTTWSDVTTQSSAAYTNLSPGDYTFELLGRNSDGLWTPQPITLNFTIPRPWYTTFYARILYVLLGVLLLWAFVNAREQRVLSKNLSLEKLIDERTGQIRQQKVQLENLNEEIRTQNENLSKATEELERTNREAGLQNESLRQTRDELQQANEVITSQNRHLAEANRAIEKALAELERSQERLKNSLGYAKRIQVAIMPSESQLEQLLPEHFLYYAPKDIVSGDFSFALEQNGYRFLAVVDCTGHGVPGAFMSVLGNSLLNQAIGSERMTDPGKILSRIHNLLNARLNIGAEERETGYEGMDIGLAVISPKGNVLKFAGAKLPLFYVKGEKVAWLDGEEHNIGGPEPEKAFKTQSLKLEGISRLYLATDGIKKQFGGEKGLILEWQGLADILGKMQHLPVKQQVTEFKYLMRQWQGTQKQLDDMMMLGWQA